METYHYNTLKRLDQQVNADVKVLDKRIGGKTATIQPRTKHGFWHPLNPGKANVNKSD